MSGKVQTAVLIGVLVLALLAWLGPLAAAVQMEWEAKKKRGGPPDYDERQRLARQRAGNHALYALVGFLALWAVVEQFGWFTWTGAVLDMVVCALLLAWCVWTVDCVLNDAAAWGNKRFDGDGAALLSAVCMLSCISSIEIFDSWAPCAFACGNIAALYGARLYKRRKERAQRACSERK